MTDTEIPPILTVAEAAELVRVTNRTIRRWVVDGRLLASHTCPGGRVLIKRDDLLKMVGIDLN